GEEKLRQVPPQNIESLHKALMYKEKQIGFFDIRPSPSLPTLLVKTVKHPWPTIASDDNFANHRTEQQPLFSQPRISPHPTRVLRRSPALSTSQTTAITEQVTPIIVEAAIAFCGLQ
ncbi:Hypothetical predicted protein, partial [Olea europaea subsp. europaea]